MAQILANALVSAAGYLLVGLGFSLIYTTARFFHFAHGIVITLGAYAAFTLRVVCGAPMPAAILGGIACSALAGTALDWGIYRPLRRRKASAAMLLLASLGIYTVLQGAISLAFGSGTKTFRGGVVPEGLDVYGVRITVPQLWLVVISAVCVGAVWLLLQGTRAGAVIRAVADDAELAAACGLNQERAIACVFLVGSATAGVAAVLIAFDGDLTPLMGFRVLLMGIIAAVIGGIGRLPGMVLGALLLSLLQHLCAWYVSSAWQDVLVFVMLIAFLVFRPQGFLGRKLAKGAV